MKQRVKDFVIRYPVYAVVLLPLDIFDALRGIVHRLKLPEQWHIENGAVTFPIGTREYLVIDGYDYGVADKPVPLDEQKSTAKKHLIEEGYSSKDADELIDGLPVREGTKRTKNLQASWVWLQENPEIRQQVLRTIQEAKSAAEEEMARERKIL